MTKSQASTTEVRIDPGALFARWFWLVYAPLGVFGVLIGLAFVNLLPRWGIAAMLAASFWAAVAVRLLAERLRKGLEVPLPRNLVGGISWIAGLATTGGVFVWIGLSKLSSDPGIVLALAGVVLIVVSVVAPLFKGVDVLMRMAGRFLVRAFLQPPVRVTTRPAPQPRPVSQPRSVASSRRSPPRPYRRPDSADSEEVAVTSAASRG